MWTDEPKAAILLGGMHYFIDFEIIYDDRGIPDKCKIIQFYKTSQELTVEPNHKKFRPYIKWGGSPDFRQDEYYPVSDDDRPYTFLCMVDNGWGDSGTCNIFILTRLGESGLEIEDVYMEASCC